MMGGVKIDNIIPINYTQKPFRYITVQFIDGPWAGKTDSKAPAACVETMRIMLYSERPFLHCLYMLKYEDMAYTATFLKTLTSAQNGAYLNKYTK